MAGEIPLNQSDAFNFSSRVLAEPSPEKGIPHNCGIIGIYAPGIDVAGLLIQGMESLQHRGQEGVGIAIDLSRKGGQLLIKERGYVIDNFDSIAKFSVGKKIAVADLRSVGPSKAIGQTRYSTSGDMDAWQPFYDKRMDFSLVHNGNFTNVAEMLEMVSQDRKVDKNGYPIRPPSDTWIAHNAILSADGSTWEEKIRNSVTSFKGAYNLIMQSSDRIFAVRDPWGMRPLVLGKLIDGEGFVLASETTALASLHARYVRDIQRGEGISIGLEGVKTFMRDERVSKLPEAFCSFEYVYIAAADSLINGVPVSLVRYRIGAALARRDVQNGLFETSDPNIPFVVGGVQFSGTHYGQGYFEEVARLVGDRRRIYNRTVLMQNRYSGGKRVFIQPEGREAATLNKHRSNPFDVSGSIVIAVDDSSVRGTTAAGIEYSFETAGDTYDIPPPHEVHLRYGSPPVFYECNWGVATRNDQLATRIHGKDGMTKDQVIEAMAKAAGVKSMAFAEDADLVGAIRPDYNEPHRSGDLYMANGLCGNCFDGFAPMEIDSLLELDLNGKREEGN